MDSRGWAETYLLSRETVFNEKLLERVTARLVLAASNGSSACWTVEDKAGVTYTEENRPILTATVIQLRTPFGGSTRGYTEGRGSFICDLSSWLPSCQRISPTKGRPCEHIRAVLEKLDGDDNAKI